MLGDICRTDFGIKRILKGDTKHAECETKHGLISICVTN